MGVLEELQRVLEGSYYATETTRNDVPERDPVTAVVWVMATNTRAPAYLEIATTTRELDDLRNRAAGTRPLWICRINYNLIDKLQNDGVVKQLLSDLGIAADEDRE